MFYDYSGKDFLQEVSVHCIHQIVNDIIKVYQNAEKCDEIQIYVFSDDVDYFISGLMEQIEDLYVSDDFEMGDVNDFVVLITLSPDGEIFVEDAHFEIDGVIKEPSEYFNYIDAELPYYVISEVSKHEVPVLVYHIAEGEGCEADDEMEYFFDGNAYHGFKVMNNLPCGSSYKTYFTTEPLTKDRVDYLMTIL